MTEYELTNEWRNLCALRGTRGVLGSASAAQKAFLQAANKRSLGVQKLNTEPVLRDEYHWLLKVLPPIVEDKFDHSRKLETVEGKAQAIVKLINKHSGEIVELDSNLTEWTLQPVLPGVASGPPPEQFFCCPNGVPAGLRWGKRAGFGSERGQKLKVTDLLKIMVVLETCFPAQNGQAYL